MATYPKISGNADSRFDLLAKNVDYGGTVISMAANTGVFYHTFTHGVDGHTESYVVFIIKNTVPESEAETFLRINEITIKEGDIFSGSNLGTVQWSATSEGPYHLTSGPIEFDYKEKNADGSDKDNPFIGIQVETPGSGGTIASGGVSNYVKHEASAYNAYSSEDYFLNFKVEDKGGEGVVNLKPNTEALPHFIMPITDAATIVNDNGGIPNNSYVAIVARVNIDNVAAFDVENYVITIKHDGTTSSGNSNDIRIPISLNSDNVMAVRIMLGDAVESTTDSNPTGKVSSSKQVALMNYVGKAYDPTNFGLDGASTNASFSTFSEAQDYISGDEATRFSFALRRVAFHETASEIKWEEFSPIKEEKELSLNISEDGDLNNLYSSENNKVGISSFSKTPFSASQNSHIASPSQTAAGCGIDTIGGNLPYGGYANFNFSTYNKGVTYTYTAEGTRDSEIKVLDLKVIFLKYPLFTVPSFTSSKSISADGLSGNIYGVNNSGWSVAANADSNQILHQGATASSDNYSFLHLAGHNGITSHMVLGRSANYFGPNSIGTELNAYIKKSAFDINVRINSYGSKHDLTYNSITNWGGGDGMYGAGFAKNNCEVEQTKYASNAEVAETMTYGGDSSHTGGDGANDQVTASIFNNSDQYKDYSVKLLTTGIRASQLTYPLANSSNGYEYGDQIKGIGAEYYSSSISLPTGLIDYGYGHVGNHYQFNEIMNFRTLFYPSLPDVAIAVYSEYTTDGSNIIFDNETDGNQIGRWQKLSVAADASTSPATAASTRYLATDGLYDWARFTEDNSAVVGSYKMSTSNNVTMTTSNNEVTVTPWTICDAKEAVSAGAGIIKVADAKIANLSKGMRLIAQSGSASQDTTNTTAFEATKFIITAFGTSAGGNTPLTLRVDDGSAAGAAASLPAITSGKDLMFIDDWIQPGMMVEADGTYLADTNGGYYIDTITYNGGTNDGVSYYNFSNNTGIRPNAARTVAGGNDSPTVKIKLKLKSTAADVNPSAANSGNSKITIFKPWNKFKNVPAGMNHHYEIKDVNLSSCYPGELVRITAGSAEHTSYGSPNNTPGQEYIVTGSAGVHPASSSSSKVDVIYKNPIEHGIKKSNGEDLPSKKNIGHGGNNTHSYAEFNSKHLSLYSFDVNDISNGVYSKYFTVKAQNIGEEDAYLYSAEFVDATYVSHAIGDTISVSANPPTLDASAVSAISWKVTEYGSSTFTNNINIGVGNISHNLDKPSELLAISDKRIPKQSVLEGSPTESIHQIANSAFNVIGCEFKCNSVAGASGNYFKYLKIGYVRDTGRTKYYSSDGSTLTERWFGAKEIWYAYIPVVMKLDSQANIIIQDVDGSSVEHMTNITIEGLKA